MSFGPGDDLPLTGRLLAVDYGEVRLGLAVSDPDQVVAQPAQVLPVDDADDLDAIAADVDAAAGERGVDGIVVGWPRDMNGRETAPASRARRLADTIRAVTDLPVALWDERLTTVEAERAMVEADVSRADRRQRVDQVAASIILRGVLEAHRVRR